MAKPQSLIALVLALLRACASQTGAQVIAVRLWPLFGGGDGPRMQTIIKEFDAAQQEVRAITTILPWGELFYSKRITASAVGAGPDVAALHLS
ncbi:MAG TPA: hypothetical protein VGU61_05905 [Noviherbaspirillum sp.]|jgi:multiple sugar transport system substrate-binding protein|uniref:hypothetical protein n=1 Tax=Noviherbaspirillum sp. TaxID=1926288 RepID=UPI002DDCAE2B|nr:hypothetical protein [Noviherbaspirillum sp.]HEV2609783.1 hypothetical protein [Noviherbaspirillum sp.]